jgi:hypothetical protein
VCPVSQPLLELVLRLRLGCPPHESETDSAPGNEALVAALASLLLVGRAGEVIKLETGSAVKT